MLENPLKDTFSYQVDVVIPDVDTNFSDLTDLFSSYEFYLLTEISLDRVIDPLFVEAFVKNGSIYLHSFNTKLDCDDCVCLLPNGNLIMHLTPRTYERIPVQHKKQTSKHSGLLKYEVQIDLTCERPKELVDVFKNYKYSFYVYWEPNEELTAKNLNVFETLKNFFGENHLTRCKNRVEKQSHSLNSKQLVDSVFNKADFNLARSWKPVLDLSGCLFNNIKPDFLFPTVPSNEKIYISAFRIKGFYPNRIYQKITAIVKRTYENEKILTILHGFQDSPISLYDESVRIAQTCRLNTENFAAILQTPNNSAFYFYDSAKSFIEIK